MAANAEVYDYVIVGAGVAGTYCGYLLTNNYKMDGSKILMLERLNRIGGLLKSDLVKIDGHIIKMEEGGMRFTKEMLTYKLCEELGLQIGPFKSATDKNLNNMRGTQFTNEQAKELNIWYKLYNTGIEGSTKSPYEILNDVFSSIQTANGGTLPLTPQDWQNVRIEWKVDNIPLYKWDFEFLLRRMDLNYETIRMIQYSIGFKSLFNRDCNAGFGFQSNLDFTEEAQFHTLPLGYDLLPETLAKNFCSKKGNLQLQSEVTIIKQPTNNDDPIEIEYVNLVTKETKSVNCKNLVLALPKLALQKLATTNQWLGSVNNFNRYVNSVISESLTKINLYYDHQWWYQFGIIGGGNFTDLKLGSVYVFTPILPNGEKKYSCDTPGALTVYCDYDSGFYWHSLQEIGDDYEPSINQPQDSVLAKNIVVEVITDQLSFLFKERSGIKFQCEYPPKPLLATYTHWTEPRFGDSVHAWKVGSNDKEISPGVHTVLGPKIAIIGETYSIKQEWVEGALMHTDQYLKSKIIDYIKSNQ